MLDRDRLAEYILECIEEFRDMGIHELGWFDGEEDMCRMMEENPTEFFDAVREITRNIHITYQPGGSDE